jgi:hypothetical protein
MNEFVNDVQDLSLEEIEAVSGGASFGTVMQIGTALADFASGFVAGVKDAMKLYM